MPAIFNKFETNEAGIFSGRQQRFKAFPRVRLWLNRSLDATSEILAFDLIRDLNGLGASSKDADIFEPIALGGPPFQVIAAVTSESDNFGRDIVTSLLERGSYQGVLYSFSVNQIALENFPDPKRNGIYKPQAAWAKLQPTDA